MRLLFFCVPLMFGLGIANAYIAPNDGNTTNTSNANKNLGAAVAKKTSAALKTFKDVNCDTIGCKNNGAQSFEDNSSDGGQKTFKVDPNSASSSDNSN